MTPRVAVLVDADNIAPQFAGRISKEAASKGKVDVMRCYLNAQKTSAWLAEPGFRACHAGIGKNAADVLLSIDAMELALTSDIGVFVLASSDGDFSHLAIRLRERGLTVLGLGEAKAPEAFRKACSGFVQVQTPPKPAAKPKSVTTPAPPPLASPGLPPGVSLDEAIRSEIAMNSQKGKGMLITELAPLMHRTYGVKISEQSQKTWRGYFKARPNLYDLDPPSQQSRVRYRPEGFQAAGH